MSKVYRPQYKNTNGVLVDLPIDAASLNGLTVDQIISSGRALVYVDELPAAEKAVSGALYVINSELPQATDDGRHDIILNGNETYYQINASIEENHPTAGSTYVSGYENKIKLDRNSNIEFNAETSGELIVTVALGETITFDGILYYAAADNTKVRLMIADGSHTISKGNATTTYIYDVEFVTQSYLYNDAIGGSSLIVHTAHNGVWYTYNWYDNQRSKEVLDRSAEVSVIRSDQIISDTEIDNIYKR